MTLATLESLDPANFRFHVPLGLDLRRPCQKANATVTRSTARVNRWRSLEISKISSEATPCCWSNRGLACSQTSFNVLGSSVDCPICRCHRVEPVCCRYISQIRTSLGKHSMTIVDRQPPTLLLSGLSMVLSEGSIRDATSIEMERTSNAHPAYLSPQAPNVHSQKRRNTCHLITNLTGAI